MRMISHARSAVNNFSVHLGWFRDRIVSVHILFRCAWTLFLLYFHLNSCHMMLYLPHYDCFVPVLLPHLLPSFCLQFVNALLGSQFCTNVFCNLFLRFAICAVFVSRLSRCSRLLSQYFRRSSWQVCFWRFAACFSVALLRSSWCEICTHFVPFAVLHRYPLQSRLGAFPS